LSACLLATERERERKERYIPHRERERDKVARIFLSLSLWALNACLFVCFFRERQKRER
jgi:hypothetical protein